MKSLSVIVLAVLALQPVLRAETRGEAPDPKEVYDLIRTHLGGMSEDELNRKAVRGLVSALKPVVSLASETSSGRAASDGPPVTQTNVFDKDIGYLRVQRVDEGLAKAVEGACEKLQSTNQLRGVVVDLRYAGGDDYAAVAATAELFVKKSRPLLDWGSGEVRSKEKAEVIAGPVAVLVNRQTSGAAEALAGVLRQAAAALVLGHKTAGQAMIAQEFPLKNGDRLRIRINPVKLGDGSALPAEGLAPDISVEVSADEEQAYFADAYQQIPRVALSANTQLSLTNSVASRNGRRPRLNEAELVRERREGTNPEADLTAGRPAEPEGPGVRDPVLARALDVLKGLAVVRRAHS